MYYKNHFPVGEWFFIAHFIAQNMKTNITKKIDKMREIHHYRLLVAKFLIKIFNQKSDQVYNKMTNDRHR